MKIDRKPTPQDVTWFLDMNNNKRLDLSPSYQRKSVWNKSDREFFLDTIINNFPCPPVFIHKDMDPDGNAKYRVIDGKQRLLTVIMYSQDEFAVSNDDEAHPLAGKKFSEIDPDFKKAFWNYTFPVELINEDNKEVLKGIFDRLNRNNKALNPQELRKARYEGNLQKFIEKESEDPYWANLVRFSKHDFSRMVDHQFICEIILMLSDRKIHGFDHFELDEFYAQNDKEFEQEAYIKEHLDLLKNFFTQVNNQEGTLKEFFYTRSAVYSLWSLFMPLAKSLPTDLKDISQKFTNFAASLNEEGENSEDPSVKDYAIYNKGATTDRTPREKRFLALKSYFSF
ncbi:MAG: hypothetical protein A2504_00330 [Bdellovibrionales bacterium RIFOXYD12_FULL_39_22]|nr:MAG: hypothetical protein A2385_13910 [Bdellovibrionales bacterium RIFOXYB1_FULL_39_21]OFZ42427.1 MAG: hypothetical protein A2485_03960 [Bdellovibrionales bacterium RIFOXYC12_FULL_39_17]OFZ45403.1 MAG: hypothetical protein A2404_01400 [Bdellovibrionales bacterium RIFOXYC1_FULL_39_130]OFZ73192.1 MAG: hypothetical protein A2451_16765 [Bdellovibrionales bacterium RIFOXYC2_FULL_39_8]OFZ74600.1 MAG: hypothetical protein A2560_09430 [Bdellovibrionales bacterium RIFOXYD1_FULL_39_84]OFZ92882.1 MAG: